MLVKTTLENALKNILTKENTTEDAAKDLADAIDAYIKTASVVGTCPAGAVTGGLR